MNEITAIRLSKESGLWDFIGGGCPKAAIDFAALVAAHTREECAKAAELCIKTEPKVSIRAANAIAAAIRSRT